MQKLKNFDRYRTWPVPDLTGPDRAGPAVCRYRFHLWGIRWEGDGIEGEDIESEDIEGDGIDSDGIAGKDIEGEGKGD